MSSSIGIGRPRVWFNERVQPGHAEIDFGEAEAVVEASDSPPMVGWAIPLHHDDLLYLWQSRLFTIRSISWMDARISSNAGAAPKIMAVVLAYVSDGQKLHLFAEPRCGT